jgi:hypothetical protein
MHTRSSLEYLIDSNLKNKNKKQKTRINNPRKKKNEKYGVMGLVQLQYIGEGQKMEKKKSV